MKKIALFILTVFLSCNQSTNYRLDDTTNSSKDSSKVDRSSPKDTLRNINPSNGIFTLDDLTTEFYLIFKEDEKNESGENLNLASLDGYLYNLTPEELRNLKWLKRHDTSIGGVNDKLPVCEIADNKLIIPFNVSEDVVLLTRWEDLKNDSIKFEATISPEIHMAHSVIKSIDFIKDEFFILLTNGSEGGEDWSELILVSYDGKLKTKQIEKFSIGYCRDCGDWAKLHYNIRGKTINVYETRDSMKNEGDKWTRLHSKTKLLRKINI